MDFFLNLLLTSLNQVLLTFAHNWPYLLASIILAVALKLYLDPARVSAFLNRWRGAGVAAATTAAVATPLCSCGTTAVILGMMAGSMPWAPVVAFMAASPLTSPQELVYSAGLFGWPFAIAFFAASILLGLGAGLAAALLERAGWLKNQARFAPACCARPREAGRRVTWQDALREAWNSGARLVLMFFGFAFIGYFLNGLIPQAWVAALFGSGQVYSVPLAATLGLPAYINSEASLPLVRAMLDAGMSQGAALAFLIAGSGTSIGAISGALTIARWRVVGLVVASLWVCAVATGYLFNLFV